MPKRSAAWFVPAGFVATVIVVLVVAFLIPHDTTSIFFVHLLVLGVAVGAVEVVAGMVVIAVALRKKRLPPSG
jgi:hypothetical protein